MFEKNAWGWALSWSWEHEGSSLPVSIFKLLLKGPPLPLDGNCGLMDPGEGAAQGCGEPRVQQAAYTLLVVPEELQLDGHIKQKTATHLLLARRRMSSALSSCGFSWMQLCAEADVGQAGCSGRWLLQHHPCRCTGVCLCLGSQDQRRGGNGGKYYHSQMKTSL